MKHLLDKIDKKLSPLEQAYLIQEEASKVGSDWENAEQVIEKIHEEIGEFKENLQENDYEKMIDEFGDILMAVVNLARFTNIKPDIALERTLKKFRVRFANIEKQLLKRGKTPQTSNLQEMDEIWNESKKII